MKKYTQKEKALQLYQLHHADKPLVLPNIWDILGAKLLADIGYSAIATASASIAYSNGYHDGERIPFCDLLVTLTKIANSVNVPVTADIESGYTDDSIQLQENIRQLIKTGIVGINIEDTNHATKSMYSVENQCNRIKMIRAISDELDIPLFINTRTDVLLYDKDFPTDEVRLAELIKRGMAYKEAGADSFFPIALRQTESIQKLVSELKMPINILTLPGIPDLKILQEIGVSRISLGPSFLKIAIKAMKSLAVELKNYEGLHSITENEISSEYLKSVISN
ncbi:MAG: isocitrate lyase/phosphoenolpyruvate mutase family protein [Chitinophagaceae bacterium]|nr:isocitrate lyase/phosphoenolpyruvate mutase family protein [Chitinophagaceae bacterium]